MCIISFPIVSVTSTKIFAMVSKDNKRQLLVYRNAVNTHDENVMCLPVPNIASLKLEKVYDDLFDDCKHSFAEEKGRGSSRILEGIDPLKGMNILPIIEHGSYNVVIVPSMSDLTRVPSEITTLTNEVIDFLKKQYTQEGWGVVLCKLKPGKTDYTPFAYSHDRLSTNELFLPTMHFHVHESTFSSYPTEGKPIEYNSDVNKPIKPMIVDTTTADWDHTIYTCNTQESAHNVSLLKPYKQNRIDWGKMPKEFQAGVDVSLRCFQREGSHFKNEDIRLPLDLEPTPVVEEVANVAANPVATPIVEEVATAANQNRFYRFLRSLSCTAV